MADCPHKPAQRLSKMAGYCRCLLTSYVFRTFSARSGVSRKLLENNSTPAALSMVGGTCGRLQTQHHHHYTATHLHSYQSLSVWKYLSRQKFSTETDVTLKEDSFPPLPEYNASPEPGRKEVFVIRLRGLPWSCTPKDILEFFSECRIHGGVNGIHFTENRRGKPNGGAVIELEHKEDIPKALERHRQYLGSRYVEVYEVTNSEAEKILKNMVPHQDGVVRLQGVPFSSTEKEIAQFFSGLEIVPNGVTLVKDKLGRHTGDAFVEFASQEIADQALLKDRELISNRYIQVFSSRKSEVHSQRGRWDVESDSRPSRRTMGDERAFQPAIRPESRRTAPISTTVSSVPTHCVHMRGLPFKANGEDIVNFFSPLKLAKIVIEYSPDGRSCGEADVFFSSHEDAVSAMSKDRAYMQERYIELFLNSPST
ncbi:hypothetical protein AGOR_G00049240 [Albula goreensis]|uniref:RRM domain-containing protein n=1 Tax=Albula goreensis TaxID=1534307 RepID=A0A8T3E0H2_9TELE|nr:hypothetical protein AGOR_G00049240 [Albula goreensis]